MELNVETTSIQLLLSLQQVKTLRNLLNEKFELATTQPIIFSCSGHVKHMNCS